MSHAPVGDTLVTVTVRDTNDVDVLIDLEDGGNVDGLLEVGLCELDLVGNGSTVDLDLHEVRLLLLDCRLGDLGVCEDSDDGAVLADPLELACNALAGRLGVLGGVLGEGLFLALVPVLVEPTLDLVAQVLGPDGGERAQAARRLDVADDTDDDHRRGLDDGGSLDNLLLVHLCGRGAGVSA